MDKSVFLSLGSGDLHNGFPTVTVQLWENRPHPALTKFTGSLPAAPKIAELYKSWQLLYLALSQRLDLHPRLEIDTGDITNVSEVEFSDLCQQLADEINLWLNSESFCHIDRQLRTQLSPDDEIRTIIETNDRALQRLPWHLWNFFEHYPQAEVALSAADYKTPYKAIAKPANKRVKILAIVGDSRGIDPRKDRAFIEQLANRAEIKFLVNPQPEQLSDRLWEQGWDMLFFAGHSSSQEKGLIQLNEQNAVSLDKFKYALKKAIERGLKLAIFNSCDGLGLAQDLADLHIPQVIVMREAVPDVVAQEFLKHFLYAFSSGQSLYTAVREARERLQKLEMQYPCATWLPVICQNPAEVPTTWQQWCTPQNENFFLNQRFWQMLLASVLVSSLVIGVRQLGILQSWELQAFDQILRSRPQEDLDPRLLIVTVTEQDVQNQDAAERRSASLSDRTLAQLIKKIHPFAPQVIGLDIYRDFPVEIAQPELKTYLQQSDRLIAICEVGEANVRPGIKPPPEIPSDRLSFSDIPVDSDLVIRRQLLGMSSGEQSVCQSNTSFSLQVALAYLSDRGIEFERTAQGNLKIGGVVFPKLESNLGGYRNLDALGYQILLNYRSSQLVARQVTLSKLLSNSMDAELPDLVRNRIVLIGTTAPSFKDYFATPYSSTSPAKKMPGIIVQAHMISQILSTVLDRRPLLWWFPAWGETLWIWAWSVVGGLIVLQYRFPAKLAIASSVALVVLYGVCFILVLKGGWVPLVPAAIALVFTASSIVVYRQFFPEQNR